MNCNTTHYRANSSSVPGDPTALCLEKFHPGTDTAETTRRWALKIDPSSPSAVLYQDGVKGIRQRISVVFAHGAVWARLADAPNASYIVAAAPGKLEKVGLYVLDGVGSFDDFTVETAHE